MTAETVVRTSCDQKPHRPRVLHALAVRATLREMLAVDSSPSLAAACATTLLRLAEVGAALAAAARAANVATPPIAHDRRWLRTNDAAGATGTAEEAAHARAEVCLPEVRSATGARSDTAAVMLEAIVRVASLSRRCLCIDGETARPRGRGWNDVFFGKMNYKLPFLVSFDGMGRQETFSLS